MREVRGPHGRVDLPGIALQPTTSQYFVDGPGFLDAQ